jgi:hypothetical protein
MLQFKYARSALQLGLKLERQLGVNPYNSAWSARPIPTPRSRRSRRTTYFGKTSAMEPSVGRSSRVLVKGAKATIYEWETASGYAAVWAAENTREALFDAMERRETYATTGSPLMVRFFGGFDFEEADAATRSPAVAGYNKDVPMGGDLGAAPPGKVPTFLLAVLRDPIGANLDRYQTVSGWSMPRATWTTWTNTIAAPELIAVWKDPDFEPKQRAFYYGRVLEIPTLRGTAYDAKYYGVRLAPEVPVSIQERAYMSPIWYSPTE